MCYKVCTLSYKSQDEEVELFKKEYKDNYRKEIRLTKASTL